MIDYEIMDICNSDIYPIYKSLTWQEPSESLRDFERWDFKF